LLLVCGRLRVGVEQLASGCDVLFLGGLPGRGVLPKASASSPQDVNGPVSKSGAHVRAFQAAMT